MTTNTLNKTRAQQLRRLISNGGNVLSLYVNQFDGEAWVASHYWAAPLAKNAAGHLLNGEIPGIYNVASGAAGPPLKFIDGSTPPSFDSIIPTERDLKRHVELDRATVAGSSSVFAHTEQGWPILSLKDKLCAVNPAYVAAIRDGALVNGQPTRKDGDIVLKGETETKPLSVWHVLTITSAAGKRTETLVFDGIVMPVRVGK